MSNQTYFLISDKKIRLDKFLSENLKNFSRAEIQKFIKIGQCKVNSKLVMDKSFLLTKGDKIEIRTEYPGNKQKLKLRLKDILIYEEKDFLVINKPSGIVTSFEEEKIKKWRGEDLEAFLKREKKELSKIERSGIIHRLDKEVSGILLIAKNERFYEFLKEEFKQRKVKKEYIGLVYGKLKKSYDLIDFSIIRSKTGKFRIAKQNEKGKKSITEYEVLERKPKFTLLKIYPLTGRTHQIRVHLSSYGFPIVGDTLYSKKRVKFVDRIMLHSYKISFIDLKNRVKFFKAELPDDFSQVLKKLKFEINLENL